MVTENIIFQKDKGEAKLVILMLTEGAMETIKKS